MSNPEPPNDPNNPFGAGGQGQPGGQYPGDQGQPGGQYPGVQGQPGSQGQPGNQGQPGGYGPPPGGQGGYGQPGGYNQGGYTPNPYPTQDPYGQQGYAPGAPRELSVGDALNYAWGRFKANPAPWLVLTLAYLLLVTGISILAGAMSETSGTATGNSASGSIEYTPAGIAIQLLVIVIGFLFQAAFTNAALREVNGTRPSFGDIFSVPNVGMALLTALVVNIIVGVGATAYVIPGLIALFLLWFSVYIAIDQKASIFAAIGSSFKLATGNAGPLLLVAVVMVGINVVGLILCGLGLLVTMPLTYLVGAYSYRVVSGQPVAPVQA